jgi:thiol:disulfide interchange protein DsbC
MTQFFSQGRLLLGSVMLVLATVATVAGAQEAVIRKNITERFPKLPRIDEVTKAPMAGLYEIRVGTEVFYTDEQGNYLLDGQLIDTKSGINLTEARIEKLTAIDFATLPLRDAIVWKQGSGARKVAVFADPNCGYCKKLEQDLQQVKDVTTYTFLVSMLGEDSVTKSRNIWCAKDKVQVWRNWMLENTPPPRSMGKCDASALERNAALQRKHRINGTPAMIFENDKRVPGAVPLAQIEKLLAAAAAQK